MLVVPSFVACAGPPPPECPASGSVPAPAPAPAPAAVGSSEPAFELAAVTVAGAVEFFAKRTGQRIEIDRRALPAAECTRITLKVGGAYTPEHVLDAIEASLSGSGLTLSRGAGVHVIAGAGKHAPRVECQIDREKLAAWILAGVRRVDDETFEISRSSLDLFLDRFFDFYPSPSAAPAGKKGLVITEHNGFEIMTGIGARPGDLIVAVQGQPIGWNANVSAILEAASTANPVVVDIERGGQKRKLSYRVVP
ncbi:MAG: hypothetical protein KF718_31755 [Polyangiaceae bacterium]|nr:hypothetical protein [Polyangiaceae bacterium]